MQSAEIRKWGETNALHPKYKHIVIVYDDNLVEVARAVNTKEDHAEVRALTRARMLVPYNQNLILFSARISKTERGHTIFRMARPCDPCYYYALDKGVKEVWYTNTHGTIVKYYKPRD